MVAPINDNLGVTLEEALTRFVDECLQGKQPVVDEFIEQYPQCRTQLKVRLRDLDEIDSLFDSLVRADEIEFAAAKIGRDLAGRKIGSFEIVELIGRGGMGVVYLARDTKLKRSVAIKSMPVELQTDATARTRFRREAELLASLNHPNIAAIHDIIEEDKSAGYLVLEYVPGDTLAQRIAHKPLKLQETFSIGLQIAEAVSAAHEKGVVHRDLKPGNIKITPEDKVKVLDFGLAKVSGTEGQSMETADTQPGRVIGTPAYMSPEQARGKSVDHRTDIWSFGCIMYEMLTGNVPFEGETATDTVAMILERQPDWQALPQETPENIRTLLRRCLEKDPSRRLRDIGDAAIEIGETLTSPATATSTGAEAPVRTSWRRTAVIGLVSGALMVLLTVVGLNINRWREQPPVEAGHGRIESLAVLPLKNLTGDPNQECFAEIMTDELISDLGAIGLPRVISRQSVMQYKGSNTPLPEITRTLNADAVVEGSVLSVGESVRINVRLVSAVPERQLWSHKYDRDFGDTLILSGEMAQTIARKIGITPTPEQEALLASTRPVNRETLNAYFLGMFYLNKQTPEGTQKGLEYLQQAIGKDPSDPRVHGALALGHAVSTHGPGASPDAGPLARKAALRAIVLDSTEAKAHAALAIVKLYATWEWESVEQSFQRALQYDPTLSYARGHYSWYLQLVGRTGEALTQMKQAKEIDPLSPLWPAWLGWQYFLAGQYDEAIEEAQKSLELAHDFPVALNVLGSVYARKGMYDDAIEAYQKAAAQSPVWRPRLARTYAIAGQRSEARSVLAEVEADPTLWDILFIAEVYAVLGEKDEAFQWLERAFGPPHHSYLPWIKHFPGFQPLRNDLRYNDLLRRMNLLE